MDQLNQDAGELLDSPNHLPMESLLATTILLPRNNPLSVQQQDLLQHCSVQFPDAFCLKLSQISNSSHYLKIRLESLKILHKFLIDEAAPQILPMTLIGLKFPLLSSFQRHTAKPFSEILPKIVAIVASRIFSGSGQLWEELLDYVYVSITGSNVTQEVQEMGFSVLSNLRQNLLYRLMPGFDFLWAKILHHLQDSSDLDSRAAAIRAASGFLKISQCSLGAERLDMVLSTMVNTTHNLATKDDPRSSEVAQRFLRFITQMVTKTHQRLLVERFNHVLESMLTIAESAVATVIREGAIRVLKKIDESNRRIMSHQLKRLDRMSLDGFFCTLMRVLVRVANVEDTEKNKSTFIAKYFMDRLTTVHGGNIFVHLVRNQIGVFAVAPEWQKRHAGLVTICATADGCEEFMRDHVEELGIIVADGLEDPHHRVRCAATDAIEALSVNLAPTLHEQYHRRILTLLTTLLKDKNHTIQGKAIEAIRFFTNGCTPNNLEPYLPELVEALLAHVKNGNTTLQGRALAALGGVASSLENRFDIYYGYTMDSIKSILFGVANASTKLLHAHCLECISYVANAVGKDTYANDADELMGVLISLQGYLLKTDHMAKVSIFRALVKLCRLLGDDFLIYVDDLMPGLIQSAKNKINNNVNQGLEVHVTMEKALACKLLFCFTSQFKRKFLPWIKQVNLVLHPLLHSDLHSEIQMEAISAMPVLLRLAISKNFILEDIQKELVYFITALVRNLEENDREFYARVLNSLKECIKVSRHVLADIQIEFVLDETQKVLNEESSEKEIQEAEGFEIGSQAHGDVKAKIVAFVFNCFVHHSQEPASEYCSIYLPFLLRACKDHDPHVREQAVRGIGNCADFGHDEFKPFAGEAAESLDSVIRHPGTSYSNNASSSNSATAHVIAVSALGTICGSYFESINAPQVVGRWLDFLPLKNNTTEAKLVHAQLSSMMEKFEDNLLGINSQYKSRILEIFAQVLADSDNLATEETVTRMVVLLAKYRGP